MFNLYQKKSKAFPEMIEVSGKYCGVNMDFRNILRIFAVIDDAKIPADKKLKKIREWFFEDGLPDHEALEAFYKIIGAGTNEEHEPQFCFEFDAREIYAGFLSEYNIDLISVGFLHWYKFKILLENLSPESAFKRKIELRFMDLNGYRSGELIRAKESVQLPDRHEQTQELKDFDEIWGKAGNN